MPGRRTVERFGFRVSVRPAFWLRRWTRFPFYFESHNPSFDLDITRTSKGDWPTLAVTIEVAFADQTTTHFMFDEPKLAIGQSIVHRLPTIYTAHPGQTIIRFLLANSWRDQPPIWETLYSYQVRTEEQLWLGLIGPLVGAAFAAAFTLLGVLIERTWLGG